MQMNHAASSSSGADRASLYRRRRAEGRHVARVEVGPENIEALVVEGLLEPGKSGDRAAIGEAIEVLLFALSEGALEWVDEEQ